MIHKKRKDEWSDDDDNEDDDSDEDENDEKYYEKLDAKLSNDYHLRRAAERSK
jgi:hypothetical protein